MASIVRASVFRADLPLRVPFVHAAMSRRRNTTIFVVLQSSDGCVGIGEALPRRYVAGEEPEDIVALLRTVIPQLLGVPLVQVWERVQSFCADLIAELGGIGACGALELACLDLVSVALNTPVTQILRLPTPSVVLAPVTATVPLLTPGLAQCVALGFRLLGARDFKVKLRGDAAVDAPLLEAITKIVPMSADLRVDFNMALSYHDSVPYLEWFASKFPRIVWIEEPLVSNDRRCMADLQRRFAGRFTFCADESVCRDQDLTRVLEYGEFGAVNIRVGKHGGPVRAEALLRRAQQAGIAVQIGSLVGESAILSNAGALLACHAAGVRYLEVGLSPLLLRSAPVVGAVTAGWGMRLQCSRLPRYGLATRHRGWRRRIGSEEAMYEHS